MSGERGQATIEAVVVVPLCIVCACAIAQAGSLMRDRLAVSQAVGRAAVAAMQGSDPEVAARASLPRRLHRSLQVRLEGDRVVVSVSPALKVLAAGSPVVLESDAVVAADSDVQ